MLCTHYMYCTIFINKADGKIRDFSTALDGPERRGILAYKAYGIYSRKVAFF